jgi:hypothetical protein
MNLYDRVRIDGERGFFWVWGFNNDGSVDVFGGSRDPNGIRQLRTVKPERLWVDKRDLPGNLYPATLRGE